MGRFVARGRCASGAVTVQVVEKEGSWVVSRVHVGSAHTDADLAVLLERAQRLLHPGQEALDLEGVARSASMDEVADWTHPGDAAESPGRGRPRSSAVGSGVVVGQPARLLWQVLREAYQRLGFECLGDETPLKIALARIVEPTSKIDALRVLDKLGVDAPATEKTILTRCWAVSRRNAIATSSLKPASHTPAAKVPSPWSCDGATSLHFQAEVDETSLTIDTEVPRVGRSKEHRLDPQIQVGLHLDTSGFPLDVYMFPGTPPQAGGAPSRDEDLSSDRRC